MLYRLIDEESQRQPVSRLCRAFGVARSAFYEYRRQPLSGALADWLEGLGAELIVSAGYMQLLQPQFIGRFRNRIVNVHPSLLPDFPGMDAIGQALDAGVAETGVTVHFVDEGVDTGRIITSQQVPIPAGTTRGDLEHAVHSVEHELLPRVVESIARGEVRIGEEANG